jgi:hypothetical protein
MNHLLGTLLYINGQMKPSEVRSHRPLRGRLKKPTLAWWRPLSRPAGASLSTGLDDPKPAAGRRRSALGFGVWTAVLLLVTVGILIQCVLGFQQVNHTRERIRWARQLKEKESEIQYLARERHTLNGLIAVHAMQSTGPQTMRAAYVLPRPNPSNQRQRL